VRIDVAIVIYLRRFLWLRKPAVSNDVIRLNSGCSELETDLSFVLRKYKLSK